MQEILVRAGCFVGIILLGYLMRRAGVFKESDFSVLSKIVVKITLPAAIVSSFNGKEIDPAMLGILLIGLGGGVIYITLGYLMNRKNGREQQAFAIINMSGYNVGNFTLPFVQSFLGPSGVIATSIFDTGNAFICLGGAYSVASIVKGHGKFSIMKIMKKLVRSVAFDCYIIMLIVTLFHIPVPSPVFSFAEIIGNANSFTAMLMIGIGFKLSGDMTQMKKIVKMLAVRYSVASVIALGCYYLLPLSFEMRLALVILAFSPIASAAPAFTGDIEGDTGLASAVNSLSILCSIVFIVCLLVVLL